MGRASSLWVVCGAIGLSWVLGCSDSSDRDGPMASTPDAASAGSDAGTPPTPRPPATGDGDASVDPPDEPDALAPPPEPPIPPAPPPPPEPPPPPPGPAGTEQQITARDEVVEQAAIAIATDGYGVAWRSVERDPSDDIVRIRFARLDRDGRRMGDDVVLYEQAVGPELVEGAYLADRAIAFDGTHFGVVFSERNLVDLGERITTFVRLTEAGERVGEPYRMSRAWHRGAWIDAVDDGFALLMAIDFATTIARIHADGTIDTPAPVALDAAETVEAAAWNGTSLGLLVHRSTRNPDELTWFRHVGLDGATVGTPATLPLESYRGAQTMVFTPYGSGYGLFWHAADEANPRRVGIEQAFISFDGTSATELSTVTPSTAWYRTVIAGAPLIRDIVGVVWMASDGGGYTGTPMFGQVGRGGPVGCHLQTEPERPDFDIYAIAVACDASLRCAAVWGDPGEGASAERPVVSLHARVVGWDDCR